MHDLDDRAHLEPPDNEVRTVLECSYCSEDIYEDISVEPATMFDVNKAIMRCLVKNLAMFGLGLYIYSGEDLPAAEVEKISARDATILKNVVKSLDDADKLYSMLLQRYSVKSFKDLTQKQRTEILEGINEMKRQSAASESR